MIKKRFINFVQGLSYGKINENKFIIFHGIGFSFGRCKVYLLMVLLILDNPVF
ncbi:hypothetical protein [Clostridium lundense]|uniref:hypothetical protein n=1 Tax=Clostridium lundense TaxID=319475 RepID=UPI000AC6F56F|nr:hypothetical protein [Clostridium lundense]